MPYDVMNAPPAQMSEAQRFERLRAQDGKPLLPPPSVQPLCVGGGLAPAKQGEATQMWQAAVAEVQQVHSFPAEERLFWSSWLLVRHYAGLGVRGEAQGLLEQTLPLLRDPRHWQTTAATMARNAAALGDLDTATQLVGQLDPQSEDLQIDTNYRFTAAYVAALKGDDQTVLQVLGYNINDIPISDAFDNVCAVFRANAHERQGRVDVAMQQLMSIAGTPQGLKFVEDVVRSNPQAGLLQQSMPALSQQVQAMNANIVKTKSGINLGGIFLLPILGIVVFGGGSAITSSLDPGMGTTVMIVGSIAFTIVVSLVVIRMIMKGPATRKKLATRGVDATAQLMAVETTGTRVNHQPMIRLKMMVSVPNKAPYAALHHEIVPAHMLGSIAPGSQVRVKVDPNDPTLMAVIWG